MLRESLMEPNSRVLDMRGQRFSSVSDADGIGRSDLPNFLRRSHRKGLDGQGGRLSTSG